MAPKLGAPGLTGNVVRALSSVATIPSLVLSMPSVIHIRFDSSSQSITPMLIKIYRDVAGPSHCVPVPVFVGGLSPSWESVAESCHRSRALLPQGFAKLCRQNGALSHIPPASCVANIERSTAPVRQDTA